MSDYEAYMVALKSTSTKLEDYKPYLFALTSSLISPSQLSTLLTHMRSLYLLIRHPPQPNPLSRPQSPSSSLVVTWPALIKALDSTPPSTLQILPAASIRELIEAWKTIRPHDWRFTKLFGHAYSEVQRRTGKELEKPGPVEMEDWARNMAEGMWSEWVDGMARWGREKMLWEEEKEALMKNVRDLNERVALLEDGVGDVKGKSDGMEKGEKGVMMIGERIAEGES